MALVTAHYGTRPSGHAAFETCCKRSDIGALPGALGVLRSSNISAVLRTGDFGESYVGGLSPGVPGTHRRRKAARGRGRRHVALPLRTRVVGELEQPESGPHHGSLRRRSGLPESERPRAQGFGHGPPATPSPTSASVERHPYHGIAHVPFHRVTPAWPCGVPSVAET